VFLNTSSDEANAASLGRLFLTFAPATGKARPPIVDRRQVVTSGCSVMNADGVPGGRQPTDQAIDLGCESAENWQLLTIPTIAIVIITQPVSLYSFFRPTESGRLSRPRHHSKGVQTVPKAVYCSSCHNKHNRPQCDSSLGPLTPKSDVLTTRSLQPAL